MKGIQFIRNTADYWLIGIILIIAIVFFIRDFKLTSLRSWLLLFGLFAVGAIAVLKSKRNKRLLEELARREKELADMENKYSQLKETHKISEENYRLAKAELEEKKKKAAVDILRADEKYEKEVMELEDEMANKTAEEMIHIVNGYLNKPE